MRDELTAEEQAAIAAYKGRVTVCPPRTFSDDAAHTKTWREQMAETWRRKEKEKQKKIENINRRARQKQAARIEAYKAMLADGKNHREIAEIVGLSRTAVQKFCQRHKLNAWKPGT